VDSLVSGVEAALLKKSRGSLTREERVVLAVEALEREVNNGGFSQFFFNCPEHIGLVETALHEAGCPSTADIASKAVAALRIDGDYTRGSVEEALTDAVEDRLETLDDRFYKYPDPIADRLLDYIERNIDHINA
jgi:hypothetical protein